MTVVLNMERGVKMLTDLPDHRVLGDKMQSSYRLTNGDEVITNVVRHDLTGAWVWDMEVNGTPKEWAGPELRLSLSDALEQTVQAVKRYLEWTVEHD